MSDGRHDPDDQLQRRLRNYALVVFLLLSIFVVIAQVLGRAVLGPTYDVGDFVIGGIFATVVSLAGVATIIRYINK